MAGPVQLFATLAVVVGPSGSPAITTSPSVALAPTDSHVLVAIDATLVVNANLSGRISVGTEIDLGDGQGFIHQGPALGGVAVPVHDRAGNPTLGFQGDLDPAQVGLSGRQIRVRVSADAADGTTAITFGVGNITLS